MPMAVAQLMSGWIWVQASLGFYLGLPTGCTCLHVVVVVCLYVISGLIGIGFT